MLVGEAILVLGIQTLNGPIGDARTDEKGNSPFLVGEFRAETCDVT